MLDLTKTVCRRNGVALQVTISLKFLKCLFHEQKQKRIQISSTDYHGRLSLNDYVIKTIISAQIYKRFSMNVQLKIFRTRFLNRNFD